MWDGFGSNAITSQQCKDVQCIMGRIRPIRLCKLTKLGCHLVFNALINAVPTPWRLYVMRVGGQNNVGIAVQTDIQHCWATLPRSRNKKCWELLAQTFDQFQTSCNSSQEQNNNMQYGVKTNANCNIQSCVRSKRTSLVQQYFKAIKKKKNETIPI